MHKYAAGAILLSLLVAGCSKSLTGTWTAPGPKGGVLTLKPDKTWTLQGADKIMAPDEGTYTYDGKKLSLLTTKLMGATVGTDIPVDRNDPEDAALSSDHKTITYEGVTYEKK